MLAFCVTTWGLLCFWVLWYCRRPQFASVGLPLAYVTLLSVAHCGAAIYLLPWYDPLGDPYLAQSGVTRPDTVAGFAASTLGLSAFCLGAWLRDRLHGTSGIARQPAAVPRAKLGRNLLLVGAVSYFVLSRFKWIPGSASITGAGASLAVIGFCLLMQSSRRSGFARWRVMAGALVFPLITMVSAGFIGYGIVALVQTGSFFVRHLRLRSWSIVAAPVVIWLGLSAYVTYMSARSDIRRQVWGGRGLFTRLETVADTFVNPLLFDPRHAAHLYLIDGRMNQNGLVGRGIHFMNETKKDLAYGRTLAVALIAWVPRIIWPGKPTFGGSGNLVSEYTGMRFASGTSVGVGNVLELYINFGWAGVGVGLLVFGALVRHWDFKAATSLRGGNTWDYVFYHALGIAVLQPGGMWAEAAGACAAAALLVIMLRATGIQP